MRKRERGKKCRENEINAQMFRRVREKGKVKNKKRMHKRATQKEMYRGERVGRVIRKGQRAEEPKSRERNSEKIPGRRQRKTCKKEGPSGSLPKGK